MNFKYPFRRATPGIFVCWFLLSRALLFAGLAFEQGETVLFYGNSMVERLLEAGELEARIQLACPEKKLRFRSLAWTGDEVGHRLRPEGYAQHMKNLIALWPARTVVLGYGMNESFGGREGLKEFRELYVAHFEQLQKIHPEARWVFLSLYCTRETPSERRADIRAYSAVVAEIAREKGALFVDFLEALSGGELVEGGGNSDNGLHLNRKGNLMASRVIAEAIAGPIPSGVEESRLQEVATAAATKHAWVAELVRPKNAVVYYGVRKRPDEYAAEMPRYHRMVDLTEGVLHEMIANPARTFSSFEPPALPPMPEGKGRDDGVRTGIIRPPRDAQLEFKVADGYAVNLFASEEDFPQLRNPVQIAFDARGRLWVVTMPSFPHTVAGRPREDKILILEDTDRDGRADKVSVFAEGFDALDGIAFHHEGVIVSEQPRLWMMRDVDGDGRADSRRELLRGIDVTDSHHGGMIACDPLGGVFFCDGVFHRSQIETPFGVHRGIDSTTYRLDVASGRVETEWQSITPNPWKMTFDRYGNAFQMYGDGLVLDALALTWTPLGIYHPFGHAKTLGYGKGSAAASISSPNFPPEYQQGMASAALLGSHAVSITKYQFEQGMAQGTGRVDLVSSPNAAFRPADLAFGMDGALYVSDFCSAIIGHAQHPMRDPHWDHDHGRIWRIVREEGPVAREWPGIEGRSVSELCELLLHPQDLVREHARIELRKAGSGGLGELDRWIKTMRRDAPFFADAALEALFVWEGLGQTRAELLWELLQCGSPMHRAAAVHVMRLQAGRLGDVSERVRKAMEDGHPRVQMEAVDLVAHARGRFRSLEHALHGLDASNAGVRQMLEDLRHGTHPARGRSVPVLDVSAECQIRHWEWSAPESTETPLAYVVGGSVGAGDGVYRTVLESSKQQIAVLGIRHRYLDVRLNGTQIFSQDSQWSSEQQISLVLEPGLNRLEIVLRKLGKAQVPAVSVFDPLGRRVEGVRWAEDAVQLREMRIQWDRSRQVAAGVVRVQVVPGKMQFEPALLRARCGERLRLRFENGDLMQHNLVVVAPGADEEIGLLADELGAKPEGVALGYVPRSPKVLIASPLLNPAQQAEMDWIVPSVPGRYPFLCTFPGHWRVMRGEIVVE